MLVRERLLLGVAAPVFEHVDYEVMSAATKDCTAGEKLEAQGSRLLVS